MTCGRVTIFLSRDRITSASPTGSIWIGIHKAGSDFFANGQSQGWNRVIKIYTVGPHAVAGLCFTDSQNGEIIVPFYSNNNGGYWISVLFGVKVKFVDIDRHWCTGFIHDHVCFVDKDAGVMQVGKVGIGGVVVPHNV